MMSVAGAVKKVIATAHAAYVPYISLPQPSFLLDALWLAHHQRFRAPLMEPCIKNQTAGQTCL
jgi:hypothetical protein